MWHLAGTHGRLMRLGSREGIPSLMHAGAAGCAPVGIGAGEAAAAWGDGEAPAEPGWLQQQWQRM
jgi:hypothetical protein